MHGTRAFELGFATYVSTLKLPIVADGPLYMAQALPGPHRMDFYHYSWSSSLDGQRIGVANNRQLGKTAPRSTRQLSR